MNIVHAVVTLDPAAGGPPIVAARLAGAQARLGHAVRIVAYDRPTAAVEIERLLAGSAPSLRYDPLAAPSRGERVFARGARRAFLEKLADSDIVHLHGVWDPILAAAAWAARRIGVPYVVAPHGMLDPWSLSQSRWKKRIAMALGYRRMLDGAALLHVLNQDESALIESLHLRPPRRVIPNGISLEEIQSLPAAGAFRKAYPQLGNDPFVLFLGRLHFKKGLDILAEAFVILAAKHPKLRLVIAGPDDGARGATEAQLMAAGLGDRAVFTGALYGAEKFAALVDATCFCLPSRQEGFSVAILEALACGTPAVISQACHFPEIARHGAGEVVTLDAAAVAAGIDRVVGASREHRRALGDAGRALVLGEYTWPRIAEQTLDVYRQVAKSR